MALINFRNALMAGKRLPYDAEVEYIRGTGTQYINTGIYQNPNTEYKVTVMPEASTNLTVGNFNGGGAYGFRLSFHVGGVFQDWYSSRISISAQSFNQIYTATVKRGSLRVQGPSIDQTATGTQSESTSSAPIYLLSAPNPPGAIGAAKLYSFQVWQNGTLVFDGIPVRKGTTGELYDRVSGKFAERHGDFVVGQDVVPVEWLGSSGTQYIDIPVSTEAGQYFGIKGKVIVSDTWATTSSSSFRRIIDSNVFNGFCAAAYSYETATNFMTYATTVGGISANGGLVVPAHVLTDFELSTAGRTQYGEFVPLSRPLTNPLSTLRLYGKLVSNGSTTFGSIAFASLDVTSGNSPLYKLAAVRVGTEGAMMDTLTRRIYRNQGTGTFTYGNDLKYPIPAE